MTNIKKLIVLIPYIIIISSLISKAASAEEQIYTTNYDSKNPIHTIIDNDTPTVVYCLNNTYICLIP